MVKCQEIDCNATAKFGYLYDKIKLVCIKHRISTGENKMFDLSRKLCICGKQPSFGLSNDNKPSCCIKCKTSEMINLKDKKCLCGTIPVFGLPNNKPSCCAKCKTDDMIDLVNKKCLCGYKPSFGLFNESPICCSKCKTDEMIDLTHKKCLCGIQPTFGLPNDKTPSCCAKCKTNNMIDLISKKCLCGIQPCFGLITDKIATCCIKCKTDDMIDIRHNLCLCGTRPIFGLSTDKIPSCCVKCKTNLMINLCAKLCKCESAQPSFGLLNDESPSCCAKCKTDNMIDIKSKKCPCGIRPNFGLPNDKTPTCCSKCKLNNMINIKDKRCIATDKDGNSYCNTFANPKYDNYCTHCFSNLFPNDERTPLIRKKSKEIAVRNFINEYFIEFYHDQPLWTGGCDCTHRRRIDHRRLINGTLVCIGTDEFQHRSYDKYDEIIRYDDLMMIHGGKFIYIRFNPDSYKENGVKKDPPMKERLEALKKEIEKQILRVENDDNIELLEIIHIYYNC
jgi:hypothetical protein